MSSHNEYLLDYIGKSKTENLSNDLRKYANECNLRKSLDLPMSICSVLPPDNNEIMSLGMSVPNDLILDNFGHFLAGIIGRATPQTLIDDGGVGRSRIFKQSSTLNMFFQTERAFPSTSLPVGWTFRLGQGSTQPERDDFTIETLLGATPESSYQSTLQGTFSSSLGTVNVAKNYPNASGSGSISEMGLFCGTSNFSLSPTTSISMMTHDLISPVVNYTVGQIINLEMIWQT